MAKKIDDVFDDSNQVPSNWVSWGVPAIALDGTKSEKCDKIFGTLIRKFETTTTTPEGVVKKVTNYELKADFGSYHDLDEKKNPIEPAIEVEEGGFYNIGGRPGLVPQMQNVKIGQKIGLKYVEEVASKKKGNNPAKIIRVFAPKNDDGSYKMDEQFLAEQGQSEMEKEFDK